MGLRIISFEKCMGINSDGVGILKDLRNIIKIDLSCTGVDDDVVEVFRGWEGLEELGLGWCIFISTRFVRELEKTSTKNTLRSLRLSRTGIDDDVDFRRFRGLEFLDVSCTQIGEEGVRKSLSLPLLKNLDLSNIKTPLRGGGQSESLETLNLKFTATTDAQLAGVDFPNLRHINLDSCRVSDYGVIRLIDRSVNLEGIDMSDTEVGSHTVNKLKQLPNLKEVSLFYCPVERFHGLKDCKSLTALNLDSRDVNDLTLTFLIHMPLVHLDLFSSRISDSGCSLLSEIKSLKTLELCGGGVGNKGCQALSKIEGLEDLNLSQNDMITDKGGRYLTSLPLNSLNLSNTRCTSSLLPSLTSIPSLKTLAMYGCKGIDLEKVEGLINGVGLRNLRIKEREEEVNWFIRDFESESESEGEEGEEGNDEGEEGNDEGDIEEIEDIDDMLEEIDNSSEHDFD